MSNILIIAPHPDDETLGCGGTLLKHKEQGDSIYWLVMTSIKAGKQYSDKQVKEQKQAITKVAKAYPFDGYHQANFEPAKLDTVPTIKLIEEVAKNLL